MVAASDGLGQVEKSGLRSRLLFVAHREQIFQQALQPKDRRSVASVRPPGEDGLDRPRAIQ
jgi:hypothetical protein